MKSLKSFGYLQALALFGFVLMLVGINQPANAVDFSSVTGAFDTAGITTGLLAIGALMMAVVAVVWGLRRIIGFGK